MRSVLSRFRLRAQAATVPAFVEFSGSTLLTRNTSSRRVRPASDNPAEANRCGLARVERIADVVLLEFACAPAGYVQPLVVDGQVDVGHQRRHLQSQGH